MLFLNRIFLALFGCLALVAADEMDAARDVLLGMQGLQMAGQDPAMLAQLLQDMQDPEMMAEAKKMMESKEWQAQMKKLTKNKEFKESVQKTKEMLKDPNMAAKAEAKVEAMAKVGADQLKKGAANAMEEAMAAMKNPEVMAEMARMIKDPNFAKQLDAMKNDPQFRNYMEAMQDMMKDPSKRAQFDSARESLIKNAR